ncbi:MULTISPECIES: anhydro-N-acetylmuramic acid kinase [Spirulina sp. CCY15215]|uniref:anhydro-N-acetylmuramic acid kinase n=1 Tax=Spirulina sp. CCY15215 TaxID=2767591 RepID=UPI00194FA447
MIVVGLISGTSVDGIDAVLTEITGDDLDISVNLLAGETYAYPEELRSQILGVCGGDRISLEELAKLDDAIARQFAIASLDIQQNQPSATLIGSHGQTVFHRPPKENAIGYTLQLGRGDLIAKITKTRTVSNFRVADIAAGGHGAPLVSRLDLALLSHPKEYRCVQNLGGIGNVTYLPPRLLQREREVIGWDTGPANVLIDLAVERFTDGGETYDRNGDWAAQGTPHHKLVERWLQQDFFRLPPPKSTGRELFGREYLEQCLEDTEEDLSQADWLATLTELTAASIARSYRNFLPHFPKEVLLGGGGNRNAYLKQRLAQHLSPATVLTVDEMGVNSDFKEAIAFALLAYWRIGDRPGNLPQVTGASQPLPLGDIHPFF